MGHVRLDGDMARSVFSRQEARPLPHVCVSAPDVATSSAGLVKVAAPIDEWGGAYQDMLKASLCLFASDVLNIEIGPHLLAWEKLIYRYSKIAVNAARDHSKSTFFSYAYPIWRAWSEPGCEIYIFSKTLEQAMEFLDIIVHGKNNLAGITGTPELEHLLPMSATGRATAGTRVKRTDVKLTNGSRIRAVGYGKAIRGAHPKYIVLDDPLNDEDMWSETQRKKHIEYFKSAIVNMVPPNGQLCVVGTPYHVADLYGFLRKNPKYVFRRYPGIVKATDGTERALFPWRWTVEALKSKLVEIGSVTFAREILCDPITDDIAIFPSYLFPPLQTTQLKMRPNLASIRAAGWTTFMGVDIARSASVGADYFVIFVQAKDQLGNRIILDIRRTKGLPFNKQLDEIKLAAEMYDPALVFIESNVMQQVYTDEMRRTTDVPVREFVTTAQNKYPLDKGVPSLRILLENQKIIIPWGDAYSRRVGGIWIEEATQFGFVEGKLQGIGEHDDTVMAWWICEEATKAGGFSFSVGDDDGGDDEAELLGDEDWEKTMMGDGDDDDL